MPWNYSAIEESLTTEADIWVPVGLKIVKTFIDDSGVEILTTGASVDDAINNAEPGFAQEYYEALKTLFTDQLIRNFSLATI